MHPLSYCRHRFPPVVIQHAVWLYLRFSLSYRDVEELLAERGLDISYESVRSWVLKFGPAIARALRQCRPRPSNRWHLDEMVVRIAGKHMYLWRAVDDEGEHPPNGDAVDLDGTLTLRMSKLIQTCWPQSSRLKGKSHRRRNL